MCVVVPSGSVHDPVAGSSERTNKHLNLIDAGDYVNQLSDSYFLEKRTMFRVMG